MKLAIFQILLAPCLVLFSTGDSEALALKTEHFQHDAGAIGMTVAESLNFFRSDSSIRDAGHGMQKGFAESQKVLKKEAPPRIREVAQFAMGVGESGTAMVSGPAGIGEVGDSIQKNGVAETGKQMITGMVDHAVNNPIEFSGQIMVGLAAGKVGAKTPSGKSARTLTSKTGGRTWTHGYGQIGDDVAEVAYLSIRESTTDVATISRYTGYKPERLQKIIDYLFNNKEWTGADGDIVAAWHRLRTERGTNTDKLLLKHETVEMWFRRKVNDAYSPAHQRANQHWNWQQAVKGEQ